MSFTSWINNSLRRRILVYGDNEKFSLVAITLKLNEVKFQQLLKIVTACVGIFRCAYVYSWFKGTVKSPVVEREECFLLTVIFSEMLFLGGLDKKYQEGSSCWPQISEDWFYKVWLQKLQYPGSSCYLLFSFFPLGFFFCLYLYLQKIFYHSILLASILCGGGRKFMDVLVNKGRKINASQKKR
jgi:hypothetical protein